MFTKHLQKKYSEVRLISKQRKKKIAFLIGNTAKLEKGNYYFTPPRITEKLVIFGVIVFNESIVIEACKYLDNKADYIFVDVEKKIFPKKNGAPGNIERRVRENIKNSKIYVYKGNDLTVDAVNLLITQIYNKDLRGVAGKKIGILGAGNIGSKIGLNLIESGAKVYLFRRNKTKLNSIVKAINYLKPPNTREKIFAKNKFNTVKNADVIIGCTNGVEIIDEKIIGLINEKTILIDAGKGTITKNAIKIANEKKIRIFRIDIFPSLEGLISKTFSIEKQVKKILKTKKIDGVSIINTGKLGRYGEIIVDDIDNINLVYGVCNGDGDFLRKIPTKFKKIINKIKRKNYV